MLDVAERAYRRGALQAVQFILAELSQVADADTLRWLASWQQALVAGRTVLDPAYLGHYMDMIKRDARSNREGLANDNDSRSLRASAVGLGNLRQP